MMTAHFHWSPRIHSLSNELLDLTQQRKTDRRYLADTNSLLQYLKCHGDTLVFDNIPHDVDHVIAPDGEEIDLISIWFRYGNKKAEYQRTLPYTGQDFHTRASDIISQFREYLESLTPIRWSCQKAQIESLRIIDKWRNKYVCAPKN
jgi:hypothetical protein